MVNNADFYYNHFQGNLGGSALNNGAPAADIKTNNTFSFKKGWTAELNASLIPVDEMVIWLQNLNGVFPRGAKN